MPSRLAGLAALYARASLAWAAGGLALALLPGAALAALASGLWEAATMDSPSIPGYTVVTAYPARAASPLTGILPAGALEEIEAAAPSGVLVWGETTVPASVDGEQVVVRGVPAWVLALLGAGAGCGLWDPSPIAVVGSGAAARLGAVERGVVAVSPHTSPVGAVLTVCAVAELPPPYREEVLVPPTIAAALRGMPGYSVARIAVPEGVGLDWLPRIEGVAYSTDPAPLVQAGRPRLAAGALAAAAAALAAMASLAGLPHGHAAAGGPPGEAGRLLRAHGAPCRLVAALYALAASPGAALSAAAGYYAAALPRVVVMGYPADPAPYAPAAAAALGAALSAAGYYGVVCRDW